MSCFFGANTSVFRIIDSCLFPYPPAGEYASQTSCYDERIGIFPDVIYELLSGTIVSEPLSAPGECTLHEACDFLRNHACFSAKHIGVEGIIDLRAHDTLLHEGAHRELCAYGYFPEVFHELFAYSFSLANAKAPHLLLSILSDMHAGILGRAEHNAAAGNLFSMLNPLLAQEGERLWGFPRMIAGFAFRSAEEIQNASHKIIRRLCAEKSISLERMEERILEDAEKAVFG